MISLSHSLSGKLAIVVGGSQGIGSTVVMQLAEQGAHVCVLARNKGALDHLVQTIHQEGGQANAYAVDATSSTALESIFTNIHEQFGKVDIFVHLVGGFTEFIPFEKITEEEWNQVLQLNLTSAMLATQKIAPFLNDGARVVYTGSIAGLGPSPSAKSYMPYGVAKAGLMTMVKYMAKEFGPRKITVNSVSPGSTATERVRKIRGDAGLLEVAKGNPLNHVLQPEDSAAAIMFLVSPQAKGITGTNLNVNAGSVM
jgi:NAD(P)-dependent dehydrogenase (short-subunit alcohol dehydrogenase family)